MNLSKILRVSAFALTCGSLSLPVGAVVQDHHFPSAEDARIKCSLLGDREFTEEQFSAVLSLAYKSDFTKKDFFGMSQVIGLKLPSKPRLRSEMFYSSKEEILKDLKKIAGEHKARLGKLQEELSVTTTCLNTANKANEKLKIQVETVNEENEALKQKLTGLEVGYKNQQAENNKLTKQLAEIEKNNSSTIVDEVAEVVIAVGEELRDLLT